MFRLRDFSSVLIVMVMMVANISPLESITPVSWHKYPLDVHCIRVPVPCMPNSISLFEHANGKCYVVTTGRLRGGSAYYDNWGCKYKVLAHAQVGPQRRGAVSVYTHYMTYVRSYSDASLFRMLQGNST